MALMADVQSMCHQVKVAQKYRDFLQFLWWPEGNLKKELVEYRMTVHLLGAVSSPSCVCYTLRKTASDNQNSFPAEVIDTQSIETFTWMTVSRACHLRRMPLAYIGVRRRTLSSSRWHSRNNLILGMGFFLWLAHCMILWDFLHHLHIWAKNPADKASRGVQVDHLLTNTRWINGPEYLWKAEEEWPVNSLDFDLAADNTEVKRELTANAVIVEDTPSATQTDNILF